MSVVYCSFASIGHSVTMCSAVSPNFYRGCICYLFLSVIFLSHDIWFVMPNLVLLLFHFSVSPFRAPFDSHRNVSSSLISCLPILLIYRPSITLFYHFYMDSPHLDLNAFLFCHCSHFIGLILLQLLLPF